MMSFLQSGSLFWCLLVFGISMGAQGGHRLERGVHLNLEVEAAATRYEVEVLPISAGVSSMGPSSSPLSFFSDTVDVRFRLPMGKYNVRTRSYDERDVPGSWSAPFELKVLPPAPRLVAIPSPKFRALAETQRALLKLRWLPSPFATLGYEVEIINSINSSESPSIVPVPSLPQSHSEASLEIPFPVGVYQYRVRSKASADLMSSWSEWSGPLTIEGAELPQPQIQLAEGDGNSSTAFPRWSWTAPPGVQSQIRLERQELLDSHWRDLEVSEDETLAQFIVLGPPRRPGRYRVTIFFQSPGWTSSKSTTKEFLLKPSSADLDFRLDQSSIRSH